MTNEDIQLRIDHVKAEIAHIERMVSEREKQQATPPVGAFVEVQWNDGDQWQYSRVAVPGAVLNTKRYPLPLANAHAWRYHLADWTQANYNCQYYLHLSDGTASFATISHEVGSRWKDGVTVVHIETRPEDV